MDGNVLTDACLLFRQASIGWAPVLAPFMINLLFHLTQIGFVLFIIGMMSGADPVSLMGGMLRFLLGIGFASVMVLYGYQFVDDWFSGTAKLAYILGAPTADPSAIASYGPKVADPIMKSLASQGFLTYLFSPITYVYMFSAISIMLAFVVLAAMLMGFLLLSYFLTAGCPFFFAFAGTPFTAGLTFGYVRLIFGTMAGLFCVILMTAIVSELGALMEQHLRTHLLISGVTLTWADYIGPLIIGLVLATIFVWLPIHVARAVGGLVPSWSGGGLLWSFGGGAVSTVSSGSSSSSSGGGGSIGGGGQRQIAAPQSSSGGSMGPATAPSQSDWNGSGWRGSRA